MNQYSQSIRDHYAAVWNNAPVTRRWDKGPVSALPADFCVLEFSPTANRTMWTYATCSMSLPSDEGRLELHLFSPVSCDGHVELLTFVAHYHRTGARLGSGHTVKFGRPWLPGSSCDCGLISLPYLDGPKLEQFQCEGETTSCLWLIPITEAERAFKKAYGAEALESKFEELQFNYLDPRRSSVV